ncbi:interferon-induced very large GTPase 1-like isoform X1 [Apostichopus japonicus]|uniref:interferon-induced very large GTPase 1-like isoform X1 n=2 Tax=Stichopus japonicus TaxID=307972 RepID=UPI003AB23B1F
MNKDDGEIFPEDNETDEEDDDEDTNREDAHGPALSFTAFLLELGLKDKFPGRLSLEKLCHVKNPHMLKGNASVAELFWGKIGALDYRARSREFLKTCMLESKHELSVRDFVFAFLHCSDNFLRQDVLEKMSACQLAVPIILHGVESVNSTFLKWSLRRIVKEWKRINFTAVEHHIVTVPIFSVSFLRIGSIKNFSKSTVLNYLLGPLQGHHKFSYFVSKEEDSVRPKFSEGCVEGVWYLPTNSNGSEKLKWIIAIFNLRGDATAFPASTKFMCKASNVTIAFIAKRNKDRLKSASTTIRSYTKIHKFIMIDDERQSAPKTPQKWNKDCLHVRFLKIENLCEEICCTIIKYRKKCPDTDLRSLESLDEYCEGIDLEDDDESFRKARTSLKELFDLGNIADLAKFKETTFPLQSVWRDWVNIDKEPIKPSSESEKSVDLLLEEIKSKKVDKRKKQLDCGLSKPMEHFRKELNETGNDVERFGYFVSYLQEELRRMEDENVRENLDNIVKLEGAIEELDVCIKDKINAVDEDSDQSERDHEESDLRHRRQRLEKLRLKEAGEIRDKSFGWENFIRELGQWYEAHEELENITNEETNVLILPTHASSLLLNGHAIEIMDGDTGRIPLSWVSSVLTQLRAKLGDPPILVMCVVGVQSSGKSTLLNTMFGVQFPVRSGQCTKGLFLRVLKVADDFVDQLGVKFIFLIDSEGIQSQERISKDDIRFDNEIVTLVLCISDVTLLNIAGENVGPEMIGLLQIAAHALIRMKKVNLHSQCRIVQQRVSKVTAEKRNKVSMTQIESTLNKAIKEASKKEGFGSRYEQFSDVFDLRRGINGENVQYFPPLWTGAMSPPHEMYGHTVMSVKNSILNDVTDQKIKPQFTVSTFNQRIRDVWKAVKDEKFLFNFQDSIKAVDFDNLCMEVNVWIKQMKLDLIQTISLWRRKILNSHDNPEELVTNIQKELNKDLNSKKEHIHDSFSKYASEHPRKDFILSHKKSVDQQIVAAITEEKIQVMAVLGNDITTKKLQNDIPSAMAKLRTKLREDAELTASRLKSSQKHDLEKLFASNWNKWVKEQEKDFPRTVMSEEALIATCEDLLLSITMDMAISSGIENLLRKGGIKKHAVDNNWVDYFPTKGDSRHVEQWFQRNTNNLKGIIDECLMDMEERIYEKKFDANLLQCVLRDALQKLSLRRFSSEPHCLLKAKVMLHICGKLCDIALQRQREYEAENSFLALMENEKESLRKDFLAFCKSDDLAHRVIQVFQDILTPLAVSYVYDFLKEHVLQYILTHRPDNRSMNEFVLFNLIKQNCGLDYITYTRDPMKYLFSFLTTQTSILCCQMKGQNLTMRYQADDAVNSMINRLKEAVEHANIDIKDTKEAKHDSSLFKLWVHNFFRALNSNKISVRPEISKEPLSYNVQDLSFFIKEFTTFVKRDFGKIIMQQLNLPDSPNANGMKSFLRKSGLLDNILSFVSNTMCFEQCPLCGAPCENALPKGPKHGYHFALTHLPSGISGGKCQNTPHLETADCETRVGSEIAIYTYRGQQKRCKDYKNDFPSWRILPKIELLPRNQYYWKWVMKTHNEEIAKHYKCSPAIIPRSWEKITEEQAINDTKQVISITMPPISVQVNMSVSTNQQMGHTS